MLAMDQFTNTHSDASVLLFDFYTMEQNIRNNASQYGIVDLVNPCWNGRVAGQSLIPISSAPTACTNPDGHAFWDAIHPTAVVHRLWGDAIVTHLQPFVTGGAQPSANLTLVGSIDAVQTSRLWTIGQQI